MSPQRRLRAGGAAVVLLLPAALEAAAVIQGRVDVQRSAPSVERRPGIGEIGLSPPPGSADRSRSVVYLETAPRGAFEIREGIRAVMEQRNEAFVPHVLAVAVGTTVEFPNLDPTYHNVFSFSKANRFDLGRYARGRSKSVRFDRPGVVRVFCDIHSHMSAFIVVFGHRYFAATDGGGRYRIDGVPAGAYTLVVWNEGQTRESREVRVPSQGVVEVDFVLR
ncbi:MAG TPA: carboxypeptidase regulatory-like domain-containing protein [Vicinamibacteria bacterium]|nr:carboxypeptidase regulatory-like domain-containing protein [Vicinamibacteria bacterium]